MKIEAYESSITAYSAEHDVDPGKVASIAEAIEAGAEIARPLVVEDTGDGAIVIDGHHRVSAMIDALDYVEIDVWEVSMDDFEALLEADFDGESPSRLADLDEHIKINGRSSYGIAAAEKKVTVGSFFIDNGEPLDYNH